MKKSRKRVPRRESIEKGEEAMEYETAIGLEVHVRLKTATKLFCSCRAAFGEPPNTLTCPVCTGQPGALPVLNARALELAVKAGLALKGTIAPAIRFDRKNYFYPDLPKGYQITQLTHPVATGGFLEIEDEGGNRKEIAIERIHLEEDAGKLLHREEEKVSLVDLNRAGIPLLEIVSAPVLASPAEARAFLKALKSLLREGGISDCDMEKGSLRCDANISIRPRGAKTLGTRTEMKNLNSFANVGKALAFEAVRQRALLEAGRPVTRETRMWREEEGITAPMRSKEEDRDYRYFPDPDLPPFAVSGELVRKIARRLPEFFPERRRRLMSSYGLDGREAADLARDRGRADCFEKCARLVGDPAEAARWIRSLPARGPRQGKGAELPDPARLAALISLVREGRISRRAAKEVLPGMIATGEDPEEIAREQGLMGMTGSSDLAARVGEAVAACPEAAAAYRGGKAAALNVLVGKVMAATRGRADPEVVKKLLVERLSR